MQRNKALNEINNIKDQLIEKYKPEKIILFGSAAWGSEEINDIDLFIIKKDVPHEECEWHRWCSGCLWYSHRYYPQGNPSF